MQTTKGIYMDLSLKEHSKGYSLSWKEALLMPVHSPYVRRHIEVANHSRSPIAKLGHHTIAFIEAVPILGAVASLIEFVVASIFRKISAPSKKLDNNIQQVSEYEEKLTWKDISILASNCLGLRHVSSFERAQDEKLNGTTGDSLNLSPGCCVFPDLKEKYTVEYKEFKALMKATTVPIETRERNIKPELKDRFVTQFQRGLKNFISSSIGVDMNTGPRPTKVRDLVEVVNRCAFMVIDYKALRGTSDNSVYGQGLGKMGRTESGIQGDQITPVPRITARQLMIIERELDEAISRPIYDKVIGGLTNLYFSAIMQTIRGNFKAA